MHAFVQPHLNSYYNHETGFLIQDRSLSFANFVLGKIFE